MTDSTPLLELDQLEVAYDGIILALRGVTLAVAPGSVVALLGANGAGKTTTLKAASGLLSAERGEILRGRLRYRGRDSAATPARVLVKQGLVQVLEGRHCFPHFSVEENLIAGALVKRPNRAELARKLEHAYQRFPRLKERRRSLAGLTSGGEQQMLAIARALMAEPQLVLLDEPSMGLAPLMVQEIFEIVKSLNELDGVSFLLAEQNATLALRYSQHGYVLENGKVTTSGPSAELAKRDDIRESYLGLKNNGARRPRSLRPTNIVT
ncbi:MAG TPA: ABC transporter ATP-binding protein [Polyangiaceae bacterium]|nr:ABC transporter ATP-binding protein [Polyangiaceae bacterium]